MTLRIGLSYRDESASNGNYGRALEAAAARAGVAIELVWLAGHGQPLDLDAARRVDGIVVTGGEDVEPAIYKAPARGAHPPDRERDRAEQRLFEGAPRVWEVPMLAICRGHQLLNVLTAFEPDALNQDLQTDVEHVGGGNDARHPVTVAPGSMLATLVGPHAEVNSSHHQAVDRLADPFVVVANAPDGTIEAYEWADPTDRPWLLSVQWHPERLAGPSGDGIIDAFLAAVIRQAHGDAGPSTSA